jgi:hypothetical protein
MMRTTHGMASVCRMAVGLLLGASLIVHGAIGQTQPTARQAQVQFRVPDPELKALIPELGINEDVAVSLLTSAIRQAGLRRETTQLEKVRQWCTIACAWPDREEAIPLSDHYIGGDFIKVTILTMGRLGAGDELPPECVRKHPHLAQIARARTLADRAILVPNTPEKWQQKVALFLKEVDNKRDSTTVLAELLLMAQEAYEAGVRDAFELSGVDWSNFEVRVQVAKMPPAERIRWLVEQIGNTEVVRSREDLMRQLLVDEGSAAIDTIYAELERHKDSSHSNTGVRSLIGVLASIACMDEKALQALEKVAQFPNQKLRASARGALEQYRQRLPKLKPFLGYAPLPTTSPAKFFP